MGLYQTHIILGFTGSIGTGCSYIAKELSRIYKYKYFKLSEIIVEELDKESQGPHSVEEMQNKGNELRREFGESCLIDRMADKIERTVTEEDSIIIIDGIKNEAEVRSLRLAPNFFLFSIHADKEIRQERVIKNGTFKDASSFDHADNRDKFEEYSYGQQVKKCDYLSDVIVLNNDNIPDTNAQRKEEFIRKLHWHYIKSIEDYAKNRKTIQYSPSIDELCMTIAYSVSKMSNCAKRKVGAAIAEVKSAPNLTGDSKEKHLSIPVVLSTGYNDVPLGLYRCVFDPEFQMCYRDYLQQRQGEKFRYCPKCGQEITINVKCPRCGREYDKYVVCCSSSECKSEIDIKYKCKCGAEIFKEYVPGGKFVPGKLLDMCRALHAEEMAILNLNNAKARISNLILYTTTQPCNLCANKIVDSGIKKVIFTEPYTMKESEQILKSGGVTVERFQGIKSNAFFKLY